MWAKGFSDSNLNQLLTKYQFFMKLPKANHILTKIVILKYKVKSKHFFLCKLLLYPVNLMAMACKVYTFSIIKQIILFSCEPLITNHCWSFFFFFSVLVFCLLFFQCIENLRLAKKVCIYTLFYLEDTIISETQCYI